MSSWLKGAVAIIFTIFVAVTVAPPAGAAASDPPGRVGRLSWIENQVFFRVDRSDTASQATVNWPISNGSLINTDRDARAEIWIGATALRLCGISELEVAALNDDNIDLRLNEGSLALSIFDREQAVDLRVATPEGAVRFAAAGRYRIDILVGRSEVTTYAGQALIEDGGRLISIPPGQRALLDGGSYLRVERAYRPDSFDDWVARREALASGNESRRHLPVEMTGYQDLDQYGDWQSHSDYGSIWLPRVAADWAPYRQGRWAWVAPWGWTWIDAAPWGFAPFHYGRWLMLGNRWAWAPGRHVGLPVYAPAVVGWVGNPGWQAGFTIGALPAAGWFPLAPREVYVPPYRHSPNHVQRINHVYVQNLAVIEHAIRTPPNYQYRERSVIPGVTLRDVPRDRDERHAAPADPDRSLQAPPASRQGVSVVPPAVNPENRPKLPERRVPASAMPRPAAVQPPPVSRLPETAPPPRQELPRREIIEPPRLSTAPSVISENRHEQREMRPAFEFRENRESRAPALPAPVTMPAAVPRTTPPPAPTAARPESSAPVWSSEGGRRHERREERGPR